MMQTVSVFAEDIAEPKNFGSAGSFGEAIKEEIKPPAPTKTTQATPVTFLENRTNWFVGAIKKLGELRNLKRNWDSYGADAPNEISLNHAQKIITILSELDLPPSSIDPSVEGGVCLSFFHEERYGDIECFNTGEILAAISEEGKNNKIWELEDSESNFRKAAITIYSFVKN